MTYQTTTITMEPVEKPGRVIIRKVNGMWVGLFPDGSYFRRYTQSGVVHALVESERENFAKVGPTICVDESQTKYFDGAGLPRFKTLPSDYWYYFFDPELTPSKAFDDWWYAQGFVI